MDDIRPLRRMMDIRTRSAPQPVSRTPVTRPVAPSKPVMSVQVPVAPKPNPPAEPAKPVVPASAKPDQAVSLAGMTLPPKVKAPIAAIVIAVLVCVGLVGLTVFAYLKTQSDTKTSGDNQTSKQTDTVTPETIDASQQAIDAELETINDDEDFNSTELSDENLGL